MSNDEYEWEWWEDCQKWLISDSDYWKWSKAVTHKFWIILQYVIIPSYSIIAYEQNVHLRGEWDLDG